MVIALHNRQAKFSSPCRPKVLSMKMTAVVAMLALAVSSSVNAQTARTPLPMKVPDEPTAVSLAEKEFVKVYGKRVVESERPFSATLSHGVWHVSGTLYCRDVKGNVTIGTCLGGTAEGDIRQSDGKVLLILHTK